MRYYPFWIRPSGTLFLPKHHLTMWVIWMVLTCVAVMMEPLKLIVWRNSLRENDKYKSRRQQLQAIADKPRRAKKSRILRPKYLVDLSSGDLRKLTPRLSLWWVLSSKMVNHIAPGAGQRLFEINFVRHTSPSLAFCQWCWWMKMLMGCSADGLVEGHIKTTASTPQWWLRIMTVFPIELLLLGSLRKLGRGILFDDIKEATYQPSSWTSRLHPQFCCIWTISRFCLGKNATTPAPHQLLAFPTKMIRWNFIAFDAYSKDILHIWLTMWSFSLFRSFLFQSTLRTFS